MGGSLRQHRIGVQRDNEAGTLQLMRAAEMEAGGLTWCTIESDKLGTLAPGEEGSINLTFNSTYAEQGINLANIIIKSIYLL